MNNTSDWSLNEQAKYIRGFADGEGWPVFSIRKKDTSYHHKKGEISKGAVVLSNTNLELLNDIRLMLENLGIKSKIYADSKEGIKKSTKDSWKLEILGQENLVKFAYKIGFGDKAKMKLLFKMLASYRVHGN